MDRLFGCASFGCTYTTPYRRHGSPASLNWSEQKQPHLLSEDVKRFDFASDEDLSELAKGLVPHSAAKSTQWAVKNFEDWRSARNACHPDNPIPHNALDSCDPEVINLQLSRFIVVTRKSNGERYPPSPLHQLLCGLLRSMREKNPECPNFLDKKDVRFKHIQGTLDAYFHKLHSEGIGSTHWHMYLPGPAYTGACTYQGNYWISSILLQPTTTMVRSSLHSSPHTRTECCTL